MKLVYVDEVPEVKNKCKPHNLQKLIEEFVKSDREVAKVDIDGDEYKSILVARQCVYVAIRRSHHKVRVVKRGEDLYLIKGYVFD